RRFDRRVGIGQRIRCRPQDRFAAGPDHRFSAPFFGQVPDHSAGHRDGCRCTAQSYQEAAAIDARYRGVTCLLKINQPLRGPAENCAPNEKYSEDPHGVDGRPDAGCLAPMQADKHSENGEDESEQQAWYDMRSSALRTKDHEQNRTANNTRNEYDYYRHQLLRKLGDIRGRAQSQRLNHGYHLPDAEGDEAPRKYAGQPVKNIKRHKRQPRYAPSEE